MPAVAGEWKGELGAEVEALDDAGGGEIRLRALETGNGAGEAEEERRLAERMVDGFEVERRDVEDVDLLAG